MHIFDDVCDLSTIDSYKQKIENHYSRMVSIGGGKMQWYPTRCIRLTARDPIVNRIQTYLQSKLLVDLECDDCELQTWPINSHSTAHVHTDENMGRSQGDYNSLLYLNDDFTGGEFFTETGIRIQPKKNRLTFFNGREVPHGLTKVENNHRYTLIFWWRNTKFVERRD
jgi:hypothetical protein